MRVTCNNISKVIKQQTGLNMCIYRDPDMVIFSANDTTAMKICGDIPIKKLTMHNVHYFSGVSVQHYVDYFKGLLAEYTEAKPLQGMVTTPSSRSDLIQQLREALHIAEAPENEVVEFDLGDTSFCFEFD